MSSSQQFASPRKQAPRRRAPPRAPLEGEPDPASVSDSGDDVGGSTVYYTPAVEDVSLGIQPISGGIPPLPHAPLEGEVVED